MVRPDFRLLGCLAVMVTLLGCGGGGGSGDGAGDQGGTGGGDGDGGDGGGGGSVDPPVVSPFNIVTPEESVFFNGTFQDEFDFVVDTARVGGQSSMAGLPSGTISYDGYMAISFFSTLGADIQGEATLTVDMQTGATGGSATGFMGAVFDETTMTNPVVSYDGSVNFSGGSLTAGPTGQAGFAMQIDGAFDNGVQDLTITGQIDGHIYGPDGDGLFASGSNFGVPRDITTIVDGTEVNGIATLWAIRP